MRRAFIVISVIFILMALYCVPGVAATVIVDPDTNYVTGIRSLVVELYGTFNVEFYYGSYTEIWGTGFDFPGNYAAVEAVCVALNDHATDPTIILHEGWGEGDSDLPAGEFHIPYENKPIIDDPGQIQVRTRVGSYSAPDPINYPDDKIWRNFGNRDRAKTQDTTYAKFSPVPIPGAVWLLGSGLVGLIVIRRKNNKS